MHRTIYTALMLGLAIIFYSHGLQRCAHAQTQAHDQGYFERCECAKCCAHAQTHAHDQDLDGLYIGGEHEHGAFRTAGSGWSSTSSGTSSLGAPATLTWSIAPDNTQLPTGLSEPISNSSLITFLDGVHHGGNSPGGADLTQRTWWQLISSAFERWDAVSGLSFQYESNDDGSKIGSAQGVLGVRGDHRLGGHSIDGQISPTFLAYNYFPNNSDMVIDTDEINRWSNATNNFRLFRNMLMHEIGHGLGLRHVESFDVNPNQVDFQFGTFLMEPTLASGFDGPQLDDILGIHRLYGDANEEGAGNDTFTNATSLGSLSGGQPISIGTDATDTFVDPSDIDFVSIDDNSDIDFFSFSTTTEETVSILLTPLGPTYDEGGQGSGDNGNQTPFVSSAKSNLTLTLYDQDGTTILDYVNSTGIGLSETINAYHLATAGEYFVRVSGLHNAVQFFQLDITAAPEPTSAMLLILGSVIAGTGRRRVSR